MADIRVGGLASGMDIESIVNQLLEIKRVPLQRLEQQKQLLLWKQDAYRTINNSLRNFRNLTFDLGLERTFTVKKATSSNPEIATVNSATTTGTYSLEVQSLATVASKVSTESIKNSSFDPARPLQEEFSGLPNEVEFEITSYASGSAVTRTFKIDTTTQSLNDVLRQISADKELQLTAFYDSISGKVSFTTRTTGNNNPVGDEIIFNDLEGSFLSDTLKLADATQSGGTDASFVINGLATTRSSNTFNINGMDITLLKEGTTFISVENDIDTIVSTIKDWVDEYNKLVSDLNSKITEKPNRDYPPLTAEQKKEMSEDEIKLWEEKAKEGLLFNDNLVFGAVSSLRQVFYETGEGLNIWDIGITTGSYLEKGYLHLDENKLRQALTENFEGVVDFFTASDGLAERAKQVLDNNISRITNHAGLSTSYLDTSYLGRQLRDVEDRMETLEERVQRSAELYWRQFTAMEQAIQKMNAQSLWLTMQFSNMS